MGSRKILKLKNSRKSILGNFVDFSCENFVTSKKSDFPRFFEIVFEKKFENITKMKKLCTWTVLLIQVITHEFGFYFQQFHFHPTKDDQLANWFNLTWRCTMIFTCWRLTLSKHQFLKPLLIQKISKNQKKSQNFSVTNLKTRACDLVGWVCYEKSKLRQLEITNTEVGSFCVPISWRFVSYYCSRTFCFLHFYKNC